MHTCSNNFKSRQQINVFKSERLLYKLSIGIFSVSFEKFNVEIDHLIIDHCKNFLKMLLRLILLVLTTTLMICDYSLGGEPNDDRIAQILAVMMKMNYKVMKINDKVFFF